MKYVAIIIVFLIALASVPAMVVAADDDGVYAGVDTRQATYYAEAKSDDQAEGDEETEFC